MKHGTHQGDHRDHHDYALMIGATVAALGTSAALPVVFFLLAAAVAVLRRSHR
ncbi:hypothetical protein ABZ297_07430 [Nonomuraea sp. NPDC005983]|uniref:hypothetical protein n=1 Tax=Nonomuraea sp. NPDC005983 TaxID=3155595 RepID=UPI0033A4686C